MMSFLSGRKAIVALIVIGGSAAAQSAVDTSPPSTAPGRLIDVGGWRLHLHCSGPVSPSQPTVILEAGIGDFSVEWSLVQPAVANFARVCSYDRPGDGWSDIGPQPRTMRQQVYELHTLLEKADVKPPYVIVGADDPVRMLDDGVPRHASDLVTGRQIPPPKTSNGQLIVAMQSGHHIHIDEPQLVATTIQTVVAATRKP